MRSLTIHASRDYEVHIGYGVLDTLGQQAASLIQGRTAVLVSDNYVFGFYGKMARESLEKEGFTVYEYVFPRGELSKCGENFLNLLNFLAEHRLTRTDVLVALGGGVTGDLTGFAAASYLRGVPYIQIPTTLLAMADSSIGGKTGIDLPAGKNLAGAFWQPTLVLCDIQCMATLPREILRDGCAEVIKYGILGLPILIEELRYKGWSINWEAALAGCLQLKRSYVEADEFDTGDRRYLNLGHTLGHAIEANSGYRLSHGQAVAIGTAMIARSACEKGYCDEHTRDTILETLDMFGLSTKTQQTREEICATAMADKKRQGDTLTLVVPRSIGKCELVDIPVDELMEWIPE